MRRALHGCTPSQSESPKSRHLPLLTRSVEEAEVANGVMMLLLRKLAALGLVGRAGSVGA